MTPIRAPEPPTEALWLPPGAHFVCADGLGSQTHLACAPAPTCEVGIDSIPLSTAQMGAVGLWGSGLLAGAVLGWLLRRR
jgi:hypothetical protein